MLDEKTKELFSLLDKRFTLQKSVLVKRLEFYEAKKKSTESIKETVVQIRSMAIREL